VPSNLRPFPTNRKKVSEAGREWVGGRFVMPFETEGVHPLAALWIVLPEGLILAADISLPQAPEGWFAETLRAAMERSKEQLEPPSRIRVADQALAAELRAAHGDIEVVVAPTPETDEAYASLLASMGASPPSYLEDNLPPALVEQLFRAAERLYRLAPWKIGCEYPIRVDVPRFGIDGACLAVIGQARVDYGFLLFPSLDAYDTFGQIGESMGEGELPESFGTPLLSLSFEKKKALPPSVVQTIQQNKWPVAGTNAYPLAHHRDESGLLLPLTESDARTLIVTANALVTFCTLHRDVLSGENPMPISESFAGDDDVTVRLTYPAEAFDLFDVNGSPSWEKSATVHKGPLPGRNDPCHCGSGKKYKKCHLDKDQEDAAGPDRTHALDMRLVDEVCLFATSEFSGKWLPRDVTDLPPQLALHLAIQWLVYERPIAGRPLIDHYLDDHELDEEEETWVSAQRAGWLSVWEVLSVEPGREVVVRDLLTGQRRTVREQVASKTLRARDAVLARVVDYGDRSLFCGLYGRSLPPFAAAEVLSDVRAKLRKKTGDIPVERLRGGKLGLWLLTRWADALDELDERRSVPPFLTNTDGDTIAAVIDRFAFDRANRRAVEASLAAIEGAGEPHRAGRETEIAFFTPDEHHDIENATVIGFGFIGESVLRVETNSESRAAALRQTIEAACGELIRHRSREQKDPLKALADRKGSAEPAPKLTAEEQAFVREAKQRHYRKWADEPLPALDGKTPRQAARSRAGREQLDLVLRQMENAEQRLPEPERLDVSSLRAELGL